MNRQIVARLNVAHILRRQEAELAVRSFLGFVQQQHGHHVSVDLIGKDIVLVQEVERRIDARPQRNQERHRRVGTFSPGERFGVTNRVGDVLVAGHNRERERAVFRVHHNFSDETAQLHHRLQRLQ